MSHIEIRSGESADWEVWIAQELELRCQQFEKAISHALQRARGDDAEIEIYGIHGELTQKICIDNTAFHPAIGRAAS